MASRFYKSYFLLPSSSVHLAQRRALDRNVHWNLNRGCQISAGTTGPHSEWQMSDRTPERMSEYMSEDSPKIILEYMSGRISSGGGHSKKVVYWFFASRFTSLWISFMGCDIAIIWFVTSWFLSLNQWLFRLASLFSIVWPCLCQHWHLSSCFRLKTACWFTVCSANIANFGRCK